MLLVVAALLLTHLGNVAVAAEDPEHRSKHAQKLLAQLNSAGINNPDIQKFIASADSHVEKGYFYITEQDAPGGMLSLRYKLGAKPGIKRMQLHYAPTDSRWEATASSGEVMVRYHIEF